MRRNERSLEPFFAVGLFLMLFESWLHSDPGHHLQAPLRRLMRLFRVDLPALSAPANSVMLAAREEGQATYSSRDTASQEDHDDLVDAPSAVPSSALHLEMPKREKADRDKPRVAKEAVRQKGTAESSVTSRAGGSTGGRPPSRNNTNPGATRSAEGQSIGGRFKKVRTPDPRVDPRPSRFARSGASSTIASAARAIRGRLSGSPDWDGEIARRRSGSSRAVSASGLRGSLSKSGIRETRPSKEKSPRAKAGPLSKRGNRPTPARAKARRGVEPRSLTPSVKSLLGSGTIKPPASELHPPDFAALLRDKPDLSDVRTLPDARQMERLTPPVAQQGYRDWLAQDGAKGPANWHVAGAARYLHERPLWAAELDGRRAPMILSQGHWWTLAEGNQPLVWHQDHWWWQKDGTWFLLHEGQPWAYRWFSDWESLGIFNPRTGTRIVYSEDESKVAVGAPGEETVIFDLQSGKELGEVAEAQADRTSRRPPARSR